MDISNGRIGFTQDLDNQKFLNALRQSNKGVEDFNTHVQNQFKQSTGVVNTLAKGVAAFLTVDYATQFVSQMVKVRGEFEQLEIAFTTMLGSKEKADSLMQEIVTFAATTPFGLQSTSEATKMLLAYGESADTALDTMRKLGDIASGVGIPLKDIAYLYGTTMTQGRLYTQDLNQFLGRGIPMMDELAKILGVSKNEVKGLVEAGKVGFPEVQKVIDNLTASGSMFGGLMEAQSKSVAGQIEQLKDAVDVMFNEIGKNSQGFVTSVIGGASSVVENYEAIGKTIAVLVATYGTYKAALIVLNVIEKARLTTTLAIGAAEGRVTAMQALRYISTLKLTAAQTALNAAMMANPYAIVITAVVALGSAYYFLADHTSAAEKAQESYNKTQEEVKSKLDETKQKAEEYISILKDETATVYQQIEAYKALQLLKLKGFENLSQEQVQAMDVNELKKLINEANDVKGLDLQKQKLVEIENQIDSVKNQIQQMNKAQGHTGLALSDAYNKLEVLNKQYDIQLSKVNQIDRDMKFANMTLEQKKAYWESIISTTEKQIFTLSNVNTNQEQGLNLAQQVSNAFQSWDVSRLNFQLNEAQNQLIAINGQINSAIPEIKNKSYWDTKKTNATSKRDKLDPKDPRNKEEWNKLTNEINEADNALKAWSVTSTKVAKPKSIKPTKKSDDPVEIYKKQISAIQEQYERYLKILDANDISFATEKAILQIQLSGKGSSYEEYLRKQQQELSKTAQTSDVARKKLSFVNDELLKLIKHSEIEIFKDDFSKQLNNVDSVVEKLYEIQKVKESLINNTDSISLKKIEIIDEKQKETIEQVDNAAKDLIKTLTEEFNPLDTINKKYDEQINLLKEKLKTAKDEVEKTKIEVAIEQVESKRDSETKNITNNVDYNKLISEYQSYEDKIKAIDDKMKADLLTNQNYYENQKKALIDQGKLDEIKALEDIKKAKDAQIKKQASDDTSSIVKDQLMGSEEWANLFSNMDEMTFQQIDNLIKQIEGKFNLLKGKFNPIDLKVILKQLNQAKNLVIEKNPFGSLAVGLADLFKGAEEETNSSTEGITTKWNRVAKSLTGTFDFINDAIDSAGVLKEFLGETASSAMETTQTVLSIGSSVLAVSQMTTEGIKGVERASVILAIISAVIQIATKIANLLSNIFSKDKKKEKQIKGHQKAVDDLTNSYKDLEDAAKRALGSDTYKGQKQMIENLKQQQIEYQKMIELEKGKKKKDNGKIKEWEDALRDSKKTIQDLLEEIAEDVVQTNAKDLATELGDALVEAFGKGEDAAKAFAEVANNVLKNAVLNQLKKQFLEKQLQSALDKLYKDMGGDDEGNFNFNGLSPEEQQAFKDKIKEISQNFTGMLDQYSDLFKDLTDPNESSLAGAIKGVSEETASLIAGQVNAMRLLIVEANKTRIDTNRILLQSLDRLVNIDFNTKNANVILDKMYAFMQSNKDNNRSYGF